MVPLGARTLGLQIVPPLPSTGMSECQLDPDQDPDLDSFTVECTWTEAGAFSVYLTVDGIPLAEPAEVTVGLALGLKTLTATHSPPSVFAL